MVARPGRAVPRANPAVEEPTTCAAALEIPASTPVRAATTGRRDGQQRRTKAWAFDDPRRRDTKREQRAADMTANLGMNVLSGTNDWVQRAPKAIRWNEGLDARWLRGQAELSPGRTQRLKNWRPARRPWKCRRALQCVQPPPSAETASSADRRLGPPMNRDAATRSANSERRTWQRALAWTYWARLTFDMSGGWKQAKLAGRRPLHGRVRHLVAHEHATPSNQLETRPRVHKRFAGPWVPPRPRGVLIQQHAPSTQP